MSQYDFGAMDPAQESGSELAADLNAWRTALHSMHKGASRPAYAVAGTMWIKDVSDPWVIYVFDGVHDVQIGKVNAASGVFVPSFGNAAGVLFADASGNISATTAAQIIALIGANQVAKAAESASTLSIQSPDGDRSAATKLPNGNPHSLRFDFVDSTTTSVGGNFAGLMTFSPWDGSTVSTGGPSYQLAFGSSLANGGTPQLNIRNGIDSTWNGWKTLIHSGNIGTGLAWSGGVLNCTNSVTAEAVAAVLSSGVVVQTTPGTYTFTVPSTGRVKVTVVGAGGGSGGTNGPNGAIGGAGGGGGVAIKYLSGLTPGSTISYTVGAGGSGGGQPSAGTAGGTTSFGAYVSATGGGGGAASGGYNTIGAAGSQGNGVGGDYNFSGIAGASAILGTRSGSGGYANVDGYLLKSIGGASVAPATSAYGVAGTGVGAGASGAYSQGWGASGAAGTPGAISIEW